MSQKTAHKEQTGKTAAIYARYSTEKQKVSSIEDQFAAGMRTALRFGYKVTHKFADFAKSGTSQFGRDGYADLKEAIKNREFDVLIVEEIDRLGRDLEDNAHIRKRLAHKQIKLLNHGGEMSEIEADIKGIVAAQFIRDLVVKIRRGLDAQAEKGKRPGALTYGYDRSSPGIDVINEHEAKIVLRIFREYDAGLSPRQIAISLTRDGILSPSGAARWSHQTIIAGTYGRGMLGNLLYIGISVWNTHTTVKNPETLKDGKRAVDESEHIIRELPHLRIVDQGLWDRVQARRQGRSQKKFGPSGKVVRKIVDRSPHLLSGLLQCGACGGTMKMKGKNRQGHSRVVCATAYNYGSCEHSKDYDVEVLKEVAFANLKETLTNENTIREATQEASKHFEVTAKKNNVERAEIVRKLTNIKVQIERAARTIVEVGDSPTMSKILQEKEAERAGLEARLECVSGTNLSLHPNLIPKYLQAVHRLAKLLNDGKDTAELRSQFRNMIDRIEVKPTGKRMPYVIEAFGRLDAMFMNHAPASRSNEKILEEEGLAPWLQRPHATSRIAARATNVVSLGLWKQAA